MFCSHKHTTHQILILTCPFEWTAAEVCHYCYRKIKKKLNTYANLKEYSLQHTKTNQNASSAAIILGVAHILSPSLALQRRWINKNIGKNIFSLSIDELFKCGAKTTCCFV